MQEKYNITDAELEIMQVLWKKKQCNLTTIIEELSNNEEKNKNTIKTLIHRLVQKGAIESRKVNTTYISKSKQNTKRLIRQKSYKYIRRSKKRIELFSINKRKEWYYGI